MFLTSETQSKEDTYFNTEYTKDEFGQKNKKINIETEENPNYFLKDQFILKINTK